MIALRGVATEGPTAREIPLDQARPAQYVFDGNAQLTLSRMRANEAREKGAAEARISGSAATSGIFLLDVPEWPRPTLEVSPCATLLCSPSRSSPCSGRW